MHLITSKSQKQVNFSCFIRQNPKKTAIREIKKRGNEIMKESDKPVRDRSLGCGLIEERERDKIVKERVNLGVIRGD
jgi:hypothetical protein